MDNDVFVVAPSYELTILGVESVINPVGLFNIAIPKASFPVDAEALPTGEHQ